MVWNGIYHLGIGMTLSDFQMDGKSPVFVLFFFFEHRKYNKSETTSLQIKQHLAEITVLSALKVTHLFRMQGQKWEIFLLLYIHKSALSIRRRSMNIFDGKWHTDFGTISLLYIQSNLGASNSDGSNTMDGSNWLESPVNFPYISK